MAVVWIEGIERVFNRIDLKAEELKKKQEVALLKGGTRVLKTARKYTPVDTGNLINSSGIRSWRNERGHRVVEIYYSATYAVYVHEIQKNYRKPGSSWKFLERALTEELPAVRAELQAARI